MGTNSVFRKVIDYNEAKVLLEQLRQNRRISSGFMALDKLTGGLIPGGITLIGARPAMGKTALVLSIIHQFSKEVSGNVLLFSPFATNCETVIRLLSIGTKLEADKMLDGSFSAEELVDKFTVNFFSQKSKIKINPHSAPSLEDIQKHCRQISNLRLLVVDNIGCICKPDAFCNPEINGNAFYEPKDKVLRFLKDLAQTLDVPVICTTQLHRSLERRKNRRPALKDLTRIHIPEDLPDQIVFLYRDRYYDPFGDETAECIVAKNNRGDVGTVPLAWNWEIGCFADIP